MNTLSVFTHVELSYAKSKYKMQVTQCAPSCFFIAMNDSYVEVEAHRYGSTEKRWSFSFGYFRMKDGGMLINLDGASYTTFMKEEVDSYRVVINNKSCVFQKDNDPSILR